MVARVWDLYFVYGERVIYQVGLALLYRIQDRVL